jgi:hypothetical protein
MSKETKHTPGPWEIERIYTDDEIMGSITILAADGSPVCKTNHSLISRNKSTPEVLANAILISAAPDMLEYIEKILETVQSVDDAPTGFLAKVFYDIENFASEAIEKATNRKQNIQQ